MSDIQLTPEQEKRARESFDKRVFDPDEYARSLCPEISPEMTVAIAEDTLRAMDPRLKGEAPDPQDVDTLAEKKQKALEAAEEFWFLDPADYADEQARIGTPLTPLQLWHKLTTECHMKVWYSMADPAMIAKELNPRDVALAYRKIGTNPANLHDLKRWRDAVAEIKQEESQRQPMYTCARFGLWSGDRIEKEDPDQPKRAIPSTYITWIPGATLREFSIVRFDSHGTPDFFIPGWRDVLLAIVRKKLRTQDELEAVFGKTEAKAARRYNMIMHGLRNAPIDEDPIENVEIGQIHDGHTAMAEPEGRPISTRCSECFWGYGEHQETCSKFKKRKGVKKHGRKANDARRIAR